MVVEAAAVVEEDVFEVLALEEYGHTPFVCRCAGCPPQ